jgi:hypothetical protein
VRDPVSLAFSRFDSQATSAGSTARHSIQNFMNRLPEREPLPATSHPFTLSLFQP